MATPSGTIDFKKVDGTPGAYAQSWEDRSRRGVDGHRFYLVGNRGDRVTLRAVQYFADLAAADLAVAAWEALQGEEVLLTSELDNKTWQVFLHRVVAEPPVGVVTNLTGVTAMVRAQIDVQRTV